MNKPAVFADCIAHQFYSVHRAVEKNKYTHYKLKGGRGGAKSSYVGLEIPYQMMKDPKANAVVMRKQAVDLRNSVYKQIKWSLNKLGVRHLWHCTTSPLEMIYKLTGQTIVFAGVDDPEDIKSIKFENGYAKYIWYEEYSEFSQQDIEVVNPSLIRGGNSFAVFYTYNPPMSVQSWVNGDVLITRPDTLVHHSSYLGVPADWLGETFIIEAEHLKEIDLQKYNHRYMGEVTGTGGEVFRNIVSEIITDDQIAHFDRVKRGLDFGFTTDPTAYITVNYDKTRRTLYIYQECYKVDLKEIDLAAYIKKENPRSAPIVADRSAIASHRILEQCNVYNLCKSNSNPGSVNAGTKYLQDLDKIIIDPIRCPNTLREFCTYELERDRNGNFKASFPDKNNHAIDAVRYALDDDIRAMEIKFI